MRARVVLAERIDAQPLSQCAGPAQLGGKCRGCPLAACLAMEHVAVSRLTPSIDPQIRAIVTSYAYGLLANIVVDRFKKFSN